MQDLDENKRSPVFICPGHCKVTHYRIIPLLSGRAAPEIHTIPIEQGRNLKFFEMVFWKVIMADTKPRSLYIDLMIPGPQLTCPHGHRLRELGLRSPSCPGRSQHPQPAAPCPHQSQLGFLFLRDIFYPRTYEIVNGPAFLCSLSSSVGWKMAKLVRLEALFLSMLSIR